MSFECLLEQEVLGGLVNEENSVLANGQERATKRYNFPQDFHNPRGRHIVR